MASERTGKRTIKASTSRCVAARRQVSCFFMKTIQTDVLVCGGGCAGLTAALASARNNARTLLVERAGFVGGIITAVGLPYFDGLADKKTGRFVVGGIPVELLVLLGIAKPGARNLDDCHPDHTSKRWSSVLVPNTEQFKLLADHLVT